MQKYLGIVRRLVLAHPYRLSVGGLLLASSFWLATITDALLSGWVNMVLLNASSIAVMATLPPALVAHLVRGWNRTAEEDEEGRREAAERAWLKRNAEQPTMLIPLFVPEPPAPKVESIYFSARYVADRNVEIVRQRLAAEMLESTGDIRS